MERVAIALLGAASGGVAGLILAGLLRLGAWGTVGCVLGAAVIAAALHLRTGRSSRPVAPGTSLGAALSGASQLAALGVLVGQIVYVQVSGGAQIPLPIWPVTSKLLWVAVAVAVAGMAASLLGWAEERRNRATYGGSRLALMAFLGGWATMAVAVACYLSGHGFPLG